MPYALLSYFGFTYAPAAHGGVFLNGCLPLFTTLFGWIWLGQRSRSSQLAGLGVILIGVTLVGYEAILFSSGGMTWFGDFLFLAAIAFEGTQQNRQSQQVVCVFDIDSLSLFLSFCINFRYIEADSTVSD